MANSMHIVCARPSILLLRFPMLLMLLLFLATLRRTRKRRISHLVLYGLEDRVHHVGDGWPVNLVGDLGGSSGRHLRGHRGRALTTMRLSLLQGCHHIGHSQQKLGPNFGGVSLSELDLYIIGIDLHFAVPNVNLSLE